MGETILGFVLVAAILIFSALITQGFARSMYNRCPGCGTLNAKRRVPMSKLRSSSRFLKQSILNLSYPLKIDFLLVQ